MTECVRMQQPPPTAPVSLNEGWNRITALLSNLEDELFGLGSDRLFTAAMYADVHGIAYAMS